MALETKLPPASRTRCFDLFSPTPHSESRCTRMSWLCSRATFVPVGLQPALGFLPRPGTRQSDFYCAFQPRPPKTGPLRWIRQEFLENEYSRVVDAAGIVESWQYFFAPVNIRMETADRFEWNYIPEYEYLTVPFEIAPGVVVPPGPYRFTRHRIEA